METDTTFVRSDSAVHLNAETAVYMNLAFVIHPRNTEHDYSLRLNDTLHDLLIQEVRVLHNIRCNTLNHLAYCLMEFLFTGVLGYKLSHETLNVVLCLFVHNLINIMII